MSGAASSVRPSTTMTMAAASSSAALRLAKDFGGDNCLVVGEECRRYRRGARCARPIRPAVDAVAGDAGLIADDGAARAGEAVEERGLAHVGTADDGDERPSCVRRRCATSATARFAVFFFVGVIGLESAVFPIIETSGNLPIIGTGENRSAAILDIPFPHHQATERKLPRLEEFFSPGGICRAPVCPMNFAAGNWRWRRRWSARSPRNIT